MSDHDATRRWCEEVREKAGEATPGPWAAAFGEADGPSVFTSAKQEPVVTEVLANNGRDSRFIALLGPHIAALVADVVAKALLLEDVYEGHVRDEPESVQQFWREFRAALDRLNAALER